MGVSGRSRHFSSSQYILCHNKIGLKVCRLTVCVCLNFCTRNLFARWLRCPINRIPASSELIFCFWLEIFLSVIKKALCPNVLLLSERFTSA